MSLDGLQNKCVLGQSLDGLGVRQAEAVRHLQLQTSQTVSDASARVPAAPLRISVTTASVLVVGKHAAQVREGYYQMFPWWELCDRAQDAYWPVVVIAWDVPVSRETILSGVRQAVLRSWVKAGSSAVVVSKERAIEFDVEALLQTGRRIDHAIALHSGTSHGRIVHVTDL